MGRGTNQVLALREHLIAEQVTLVVMEATGDYWKPFYYLLEDDPFEVLLVNAPHVKSLPGRKTDVSDAVWLAQLGAHGLLRATRADPPAAWPACATPVHGSPFGRSRSAHQVGIPFCWSLLAHAIVR